MLDAAETARYSRHLILPQFGEAGQLALKRSSVLIIGAGGLGCPAALYLAAAGVGRIGLVDFDRVDISNLQRQVLYGTSLVGQKKVEAAAERLRDLNDLIIIEPHDARLSAANALALFAGYDIILDGTDNFATRYLVNDACTMTGKPNVYGSVYRFEGQLSVFDARKGPCYRCLYPEPPPPNLVPSCAEGGVLGVLPGIIGTMQASEAIKLIVSGESAMIGKLLLFDALQTSFRTLSLRKDADCPLCGTAPTITQLTDYEETCMIDVITPGQLHAERENVTIVDVREQNEWDAGHLADSIHIPLRQLPGRLAEVPRENEIVVLCRSGARSAQAVEYLKQSGFAKVRNLAGGLKRWATDVDSSLLVI